MLVRFTLYIIPSALQVQLPQKCTGEKSRSHSEEHVTQIHESNWFTYVKTRRTFLFGVEGVKYYKFGLLQWGLVR